MLFQIVELPAIKDVASQAPMMLSMDLGVMLLLVSVFSGNGLTISAAQSQ
jgi:hypothetical protein